MKLYSREAPRPYGPGAAQGTQGLQAMRDLVRDSNPKSKADKEKDLVTFARK